MAFFSEFVIRRKRAENRDHTTRVLEKRRKLVDDIYVYEARCRLKKHTEARRVVVGEAKVADIAYGASIREILTIAAAAAIDRSPHPRERAD